MHTELTRADILLGAGFFNKLLSKDARFSMRDHPTHHIAAEDVQDHVEVEVGPLSRPEQLSDIPGPDLVGGGSKQLRLAVDGVV